jgi:hypothetical protein
MGATGAFVYRTKPDARHAETINSPAPIPLGVLCGLILGHASPRELRAPSLAGRNHLSRNRLPPAEYNR